MEGLLATLEASGIAQHLRDGRWSYAAVNAVHIFGIALLVGGILPLDLRLLGLWRGVPQAALMRVLVPTAAAGLAIAVAAGLLLFSVRAREYAGLWLFQVKLALIVTGTLGALAFHLARRRAPEPARDGPPAPHALLSMACWLGALACGRMIAFATE